MRRLLKLKNELIYLGCFLLFASSCSKKDEALDVMPRDLFSDATVWTDKGASDLFLNDIYNQLPDGNNWYDPFENWSDNSICGFSWPSSRSLVEQAIYTPSTLSFGDVGDMYGWGTLYAIIRKCNVFIKNVSASSLPDEYKKLRVAEARFLRAFYYQQLWLAYGGVPIITDVLDRQAQGDEIFKPRSTFDETLQFITKECAEIYADLPPSPSSGRTGQGAAMALKGWCELFAGKWADAAASNKKIIDELSYSLHPDYGAFFLTRGNESTEAIFYREYIPNVKGGRLEGYIGPTFTKNGAETSWGGVNPTQELVDDYAMDNGKVITDPASGYDPQNPYKNREKRFYQSIVYDGSFWYNDTIKTRRGIGSKNEIDLTNRDDAGQTGYYLRKRLNDKLELGAANWDGATSPQNYNYFRFGEVLLNYAEAQNETVGPDPSVHDAINRLRTRVSLPDLDPGLSKDEMRTAIRRERRVELAFEDKRWWDLIRWHIAHINLNKPLNGISITAGAGGVLTYAPINAAGGNRKFDAAKNYLFPIPQAVLDQNKKLTQNPNY